MRRQRKRMLKKVAKGKRARDYVRRERDCVRRDCERRMECSPEAAMCEKRQGDGCHERDPVRGGCEKAKAGSRRPCARRAVEGRLTVGRRRKRMLQRLRKGESCCEKRKSGHVQEKERCQKRPCVRGLHKTYAAKSGRVRRKLSQAAVCQKTAKTRRGVAEDDRMPKTAKEATAGKRDRVRRQLPPAAVCQKTAKCDCC